MEEKYCFCVPQKALIKQGEKYLVIKRSLNSRGYPGCWDFPGGKLEQGEAAKTGLKREVMEETSLEIEVLSPVFTYTEFVYSNNMYILYECKLISGKISLSNEHTEYKWATKEEIRNMKTGKFIQEYLKHIN
jgi:8-oxo-dGTP diphosphatase